MKRHVKLLAASIVLCGSITANAGELATKGNYSGVFGWYAVGRSVQVNPDVVVWTGEFSGVFHNAVKGGPFDSAGVSCPGINEIDKGVSTSHGRCLLVDGEGHTASIVWRCGGAFPTCDGTWQWTGGTGKYAGIHGENTMNCRFVTPAATHGECVWKGSWQR